jgi:cytochrome c-type biogenesis protein CcmH
MMRRLPVLCILFFALASPVAAQNIEGDARAIEAMLVAPCCWTQQVSLHQSEAATKIKEDIRVALASGQTRDQILAAYVAQYGPAILVEPPARGFGASLYVLPVVALLGGALLVGVVVRRFTRRAEAAHPAQPAEAATSALSERLDDELRDLD